MNNNLNTYILVIMIIILIILLLFRTKYNKIIEKVIVYLIIFLLILLVSKNWIATVIGSIIIFLLINLMIGYKNTIEKFEDIKKSDTVYETHSTAEPAFDKNIFNSDDFKKSSDGIQDLLKKINGGIELKDADIKETNVLNIDTKKYSDDKKPNALKIAQQETYELINTVNALKDTITTLAPVLQEGKKLMNIFENLKL